MKRNASLWIALAALALRLLGPLPAYGAAQPPGFGEVCSAYAKATPDGPHSPADSHALAHCTDCPFGSAAAWLPSAPVLPPAVASCHVLVAPAVAAATAAAPDLLPPPRGPPFR